MDDDMQAWHHQWELEMQELEERLKKLESLNERQKEIFKHEYQLIEEKRNGTHS